MEKENIYKTAIRDPKLRIIGNKSCYHEMGVSFEYIDAKHTFEPPHTNHYSTIKSYLEYTKTLRNQKE